MRISSRAPGGFMRAASLPAVLLPATPLAPAPELAGAEAGRFTGTITTLAKPACLTAGAATCCSFVAGGGWAAACCCCCCCRGACFATSWRAKVAASASSPNSLSIRWYATDCALCCCCCLDSALRAALLGVTPPGLGGGAGRAAAVAAAARPHFRGCCCCCCCSSESLLLPLAWPLFKPLACCCGSDPAACCCLRLFWALRFSVRAAFLTSSACLAALVAAGPGLQLASLQQQQTAKLRILMSYCRWA